MLYNPLHFDLIGRLVVSGQKEQLLAAICRHNGARVSCVCTIAHIVYDENNDSAAARAINVTSFLLLAFSKLKEQSLSFTEAISQSLYRIRWEVLVLDNELM